MRKKLKTLLALLIIASSIFLPACQKQTSSKPNNLSLKIGIMPAVDAAPILLAEEKGYFQDLGLEMDIQIYTNAVNRQSALQSGELDGTITDLIAFVNNVQNGFELKITSSTDGSFSFLAKKDFVEKENISVGMMEVSVTNFLTEQFLSERYQIDKLFIPDIPSRLEMVKAGKLDMAIIPEPMASMGQLSGLDKIIYQSKDKFSPGVLVFTDRALNDKDKAIDLFHQALNKAIQDIQRDDSGAREVLIAKLGLNPAIKDLISMPAYHYTRVPDQNYVKKVIQWVEQVGVTRITVPYQDLIEGKFVHQ